MSYKSLMVKLSVTALGLVVMLSCAALFSPHFKSQTSDTSSSAVDNQKSKIALNQQFNIIEEDGVWQPKISWQNVQLDHVYDLVALHVAQIEFLTASMDKIAKQQTIPHYVKEGIVTDLGLEIAQAQKQLNDLTRYAALLSSARPLSPVKGGVTIYCLNNNSSLNNDDRSVEHCIIENPQRAKDSAVKSTPNPAPSVAHKGSIEAFSWI